MMRNSKTPTLVILCLLGVIGVITYNYWSATQRHLRIKEALILSEEKINELIEKKSYADKQIGLTADRVQQLEKELEEARQASEQKDKDVSDMSERMKKNQQDRDKFALENADMKETLRKAQTESILAQQDLAAKTIEWTNQVERYKQEAETAKKESSNCASMVEAKLQELRNSISYMARSQFNKFESEKIQDILNSAVKNAAQNPLNAAAGGGVQGGTSKLDLNAQVKEQQQQQQQPAQAQAQQQLQQPQIGNPNNIMNNNNNNMLGINNNSPIVQIQPQLSKTLSGGGLNDMTRGKRETELGATNSSANITVTNNNNNNNGTTVGGGAVMAAAMERDEEETATVPVRDVCQMPKAVGTCDKSVERYYFDAMSQRCLVFVYSGCEGNENNFETAEACQALCLDVARVDKPPASK